MNCQQINKDEWHEKYLLGHLNPEQQESYEQHLSECPDCSEELETQRQLIMGIRHSSRLAMKNEIITQAEQIRENSRAELKYVFFRAAAVLLVAVFLPGLYYYYNHYAILPDEKSHEVFAPLEIEEDFEPQVEESPETTIEKAEDGIIEPPKSEKREKIETIPDIARKEAPRATIDDLLGDSDQMKPVLSGKGVGTGYKSLTHKNDIDRIEPAKIESEKIVQEFAEEIPVAKSTGLLNNTVSGAGSTEASYSTIKGTIVDLQTGKPLPGVNIYIENSHIGASTNEDGQFNIKKIAEGNYTLIVSMIGYSEKRISGLKIDPDKTTTLDIAIEPAALISESIVVAAEAAQIDNAASSVSGISAAPKKKSVLARSALSALETIEPIRVTYQNGMIEFIAASYSGKTAQDSLYYYVLQDSLMRIYWPDMPGELLHQPELLKISQQSPFEYKLFLNDKPIYNIQKEADKVRLIKLGE